MELSTAKLPFFPWVQQRFTGATILPKVRSPHEDNLSAEWAPVIYEPQNQIHTTNIIASEL